MKVIVLAVLGGVAAGIMPLLSKAGMKGMDVTIGLAIYAFFFWIFTIVLMFATGKWGLLISQPLDWTRITYLILNGLVAALFIWLILSAYGMGGDVKIIHSIHAPIAVILGIFLAALILGEHLTFLSGAGVIVVAVGILLVVFGQ